MTSAHHRSGAARRGGALLLAGVPLLALLACSGPSGTSPAPPPSKKPTAQRSTAPAERDMDEAVQPALALVDEWIPAGFTDTAATSGHFWASEPAAGIDDNEPGRQLLQIACSGNGEIAVQLTDRAPSRKVGCGGKAAGFPFTGSISAFVGGAAANRGVVAWRILNAT